MKKIDFKNLPDKTTPINTTNLNLLQDNVENMLKEESVESDSDTYSCNYINSLKNNMQENIDKKEEKGITGSNQIELENDVPYLVFCKVFSTITESGGIGVVLGGYDIYWIGSNNINVSRNGNIYTITSTAGTVYIKALKIN